ncbi:MAG: sensor histidine kinase [Syntrophothermus sp.]
MKKAYLKLLHKFNTLVLGENIFASLHKRLFLHSVWAALILATLALIIDIAAGFPTSLVIITALATIVLLRVFLQIRFRPGLDYQKYIHVYVFIILLIVPVTWILNAGLEGANLMLLFIAFMSVYFLIKPSLRFAVFLIFLVIQQALLITDFYFPGYIVHYSNAGQRRVDLFLGSALYLSITYLFLNIILKNTEYERGRVILRNSQLNELEKRHSELNNTLNKTVKELETSNLSKDRFISIISHDLRSPFQGLLGVAQMLDEDYDGFDDSDKRKMISKLRSSLDRQYKFLDELLLWGQLQRNSGTINRQPADINHIMQETMEVMKGNLNQKNISVSVSRARDPHIITDTRLVATVFRNILSNAIKFSSPGSHINISAQSNSRMINIAFEDQGTGMSEEELRKLFRLDIHFSKKGTEGEPGTGMGMIVCSEIMNKLEGSISAESEPGKGTTFFLKLPRHDILPFSQEELN